MVIESPTNPLAQQEVDPTFKAARINARPLEFVNAAGSQIGGHYRLAAKSGTLTSAAVVADGALFSLRWTNPSLLFVLHYLEAYLLPTVVFTAQQEIGLDAILASAFTASDSGGTAILPGTSNRARRSNMGISQVTDMRIATTSVVTAGTRTLDANAFAAGSGLVNVVNAAAGTAYVNPGGGDPPFGLRYTPQVDRGEHPIVLSANEGIVVRNKVIFPAAGAAVLIVNMGWAEVPAY